MKTFDRFALIDLRSVVCAFAMIFTMGRACADDWPYYQHDAAHTGRSTAEVDPTTLSLAWSAPTGYSTPLIIGSEVYATKNGQGSGAPTTISCFELTTGAIKWSFSGTFTFPSQAAVGGGFVVFEGQPTSSSSGALYVLNQSTGALLYTVPVPEGFSTAMPTVVQDQVTGAVTAYVADGYYLSAVTLGQKSGSVLWTQEPSVEFGTGGSMPTIVGSSVVVAGPGQFYAFDQSTGAENHFHDGGGNGGGGTTVTYDASRSQFYVLEDYDNPNPVLTAYHYASNSSITLLWQQSGAGIYGQNSVAIGPNGEIYTCGPGAIWELDPTTGQILRSVSGSFADDVTPALSNGVLWVLSQNQTLAYSLSTLQLLRALNGSRGNLSTPYDSPGALSDGYFLLDYGPIGAPPGFDVYKQAASSSPTPTPTPTPTIQVAVQTSPAGLTFTVDGTTYSAAQTFSWASGSSHTIATTSPQSGAAGVRYAWSKWSDSRAISHTVAPTKNTTYTATFTTQYHLTMSAGTGGKVSPSSGWKNSGTTISITATPTNNTLVSYAFSSWTGSGTGSYSGTNNPASITMSGPITETAAFTQNPVNVTVQTNPAGLSFTVDGTTYTAAQTFSWAPGSSHTIATTSPQGGGTGVRYVWNSWTGGGVISHTVTPTQNTTYTAKFTTQYYLTMSHGTGGTVSPSSGWKNSGATLSITGTSATGYTFTSWTGSGTGSYSGTNDSASITMNGPIAEAATFTHN